MNEEIIYRIEQYLELDTSYAIIINGDYGIGKTHFIKNELFPIIEKKLVPNSEKDEKYIPVLISLFGSKSIEDIQDEIFLKLYPILKTKGIKWLAGLGNVGLRYLNSDVKGFLKDVGATSQTMTDYRKILICIDDIDRKSPELDLKEIFGFVNNLVENQNAKILLIANENELRKEVNLEDVDNYSMLREKVIGISIVFKNDVSTTYDRIIEAKYSIDNITYFKFLVKYKLTIIESIEKNGDNLRNLLFFLEHFKIIFNEITEYFLKENKFDNMRDEIIEKILNFTLPISIEYKLGKLSPSNFNKIIAIYQGFSFNLSGMFHSGEITDTVQDYDDQYKEKYLPDNSISRVFFESIFNYIVGRDSFRIELLAEELNQLYRFEDNTIPEREKLLSKLGYWHCLDLKPSLYRSLTNKLLSFVDKGDFKLEQYPRIFYFTIRFDNLLNYNIDSLLRRFEMGIIRAGKKNKYVDSINMRLSVNRGSEFFEQINRVAEYCKQVNEEMKIEQESELYNRVFVMFSTDFDDYLEKAQQYNNDFAVTPYLSGFNFYQTWKVIKKLRSSQIIEFAYYLEGRYQNTIYEGIYPERDFLEKLNSRLEKSILSSSTNKLRKTALRFLRDSITRSTANFPAMSDDDQLDE